MRGSVSCNCIFRLTAFTIAWIGLDKSLDGIRFTGYCRQSRITSMSLFFLSRILLCVTRKSVSNAVGEHTCRNVDDPLPTYGMHLDFHSSVWLGDQCVPWTGRRSRDDHTIWVWATLDWLDKSAEGSRRASILRSISCLISPTCFVLDIQPTTSLQNFM